MSNDYIEEKTGEIKLGRRPRQDYYGAIYHIIQKGKDNYNIFDKDSEKLKLLNIIGEAKEIFDFYLLAYCIMGERYHIVIKVHNIPLKRIMHRIDTLYAKYYNASNKRTGSPFGGRYKSIIVDSEYYLFNLINYIHNKIVYEGKVNSMTEYKWSSDIFYRMNIEGVVDIDYALDILSQNREVAIKNYIELMSIYYEDYEALKLEFEEINSSSNTNVKKNEIELEKALKDVCESKADYDLIRSGSRKAYLMEYKSIFIAKCVELGFSLAEIGDFISLSERSIRRYL